MICKTVEQLEFGMHLVTDTTAIRNRKLDAPEICKETTYLQTNKATHA